MARTPVHPSSVTLPPPRLLPPLLVRGGEVYAPAPLGRQDLLIFGGRIVAIGEGLRAPEGLGPVQVLDVDGRKVVPGLIDSHLHYLGGAGQIGPYNRSPEMMLSDITLAGVTTVIGMLGTDCSTRHVVSLLAKTRALRTEGISAYILTGGYVVPTPTLTGSVDNDLMLVPEVIGVGEIAISDNRSSHPTHDELARLVSQVYLGAAFGEKGGTVVFHIGAAESGLEPIRRLVRETGRPARTFVPTHVNRSERLWRDALAYAREGGTIDFTAILSPRLGFQGSLKPARAIADALREGIPAERITLSSDANSNLLILDDDGHLERLQRLWVTELTHEFRDLVLEEGVPLETAVQVVTSSVADAYQLGGHKGRLRVGHDGDLAVLGDGLAIDAVVAGGRVLVQDGEAVVKGYFE